MSGAFKKNINKEFPTHLAIEQVPNRQRIITTHHHSEYYPVLHHQA